MGLPIRGRREASALVQVKTRPLGRISKIQQKYCIKSCLMKKS